MKSAAIYARVSSDRQARDATIDSQLADLRERCRVDGIHLVDDDVFADDGFPGGTLLRPALERLRDRIAAGGFDTVYVHSPDRLARKYAYQALLLEEFTRYGAQVIFLHGGTGTTPEAQLLTQVQGVLAEYERERMRERCRRGRLFKARAGLVNVLGSAPFGYRYVARTSGEPAYFEVIPEEAALVQQIFRWVTVEQASLGAVARRLDALEARPRRASTWSRSSVAQILKNTTYIGQARFGKRESVAPQPRLHPRKGQRGPARVTFSSHRLRPIEEQIVIPVPAIVAPEVFEAAAEQLARNKALSVHRATPDRYLLQGLVTCGRCGTAFAGATTPYRSKSGTIHEYRYYVCGSRRGAGRDACREPAIRADVLDPDVWAAVQRVLHEPERVLVEWERRNQADGVVADLREAEAAARRSIAQLEQADRRLADAYEAEVLDLAEFRDRRAVLRERLSRAQGDLSRVEDRLRQRVELRELAATVERFRESLEHGFTHATEAQKKKVIRAIVREVRIQPEKVDVVFRLPAGPMAASPEAVGGAFYGQRPSRQGGEAG